jgi:hypothetical protein
MQERLASEAVALPAAQRALYDAIVALNGGRASGFFDVMAWRDRQMVFVDYEAPGERPGRTRAAWMDAALTAGISEHDLLLVTAADE